MIGYLFVKGNGHTFECGHAVVETFHLLNEPYGDRLGAGSLGEDGIVIELALLEELSMSRAWSQLIVGDGCSSSQARILGMHIVNLIVELTGFVPQENHFVESLIEQIFVVGDLTLNVLELFHVLFHLGSFLSIIVLEGGDHLIELRYGPLQHFILIREHHVLICQLLVLPD